MHPGHPRSRANEKRLLQRPQAAAISAFCRARGPRRSHKSEESGLPPQRHGDLHVDDLTAELFWAKYLIQLDINIFHNIPYANYGYGELRQLQIPLPAYRWRSRAYSSLHRSETPQALRSVAIADRAPDVVQVDDSRPGRNEQRVSRRIDRASRIMRRPNSRVRLKA